jgi:hypothetical protein
MTEDKNKPTKSEPAARPLPTPASPPLDKRPGNGRTEAQPAAPRTEEAGHAGLDQLREILFGPMYRELERGLLRLDAHLAMRSRDLEEESRRRTEVLELHLKSETAAISARLDRELSEIGETLRKVSREHREGIAGVEQKLAKLEESGARNDRELRHLLLEQAKSFLDEVQRLRKELFAALQRELGLGEREGAEDLHETTGPRSQRE